MFTGVAGTPWYNNLYFTWVSGQAQNLVDNVDAFWTDLAAQIKSTISATIEGSVAVINDATGDITSVESVTPGAVTFTGSGDMLPPATQMMLNLFTGTYISGRQLRGKVFLPGMIETACDSDGSPNAGFTGAQETAMEDLIAASSSPGPLRVFSPTHLTSAVVQGTQAMSRFAVLRSRRD